MQGTNRHGLPAPLARHLRRSFRRIFAEGDGAPTVTAAIKALQAEPPIPLRPLLAPLPSLFLPFHAGAGGIAKAIEQKDMHPDLAEFCCLSAALVTLLQRMQETAKEPTDEDRDTLLALLLHALLILPDEERFSAWVSHVAD
ncbi:MAG: hypothetical protein PHW10_04475 [Candidatus Peribacteraceae bacterium]|nr:hypothetical protein [Candidatus Peribacteraceae bacterium]